MADPWVSGMLQWVPEGFWSIQLDIVGFLAVLGEASVLSNGQVSHMSKTCLLPRLIPAPQALIRTSRPERLHPATGVVVGAHSGNIRRHVNHIPHILHQVAFHAFKSGTEETKAYQTRVIEIKWAKSVPEEQRDIRFASQKAADRSKVRNPRASQARTRSWGPLIFLAWAGCVQSLVLLAISIWRLDGMSLLAVLLLSLCSTLVGLASHWTLKLPTRTEMRDDIPPSDVIISYPNGSFLIVRCPEDIARLYFQSEQCDYFIKSEWQYRALCLVASMFLMIGVICLANAQPLLQVLWAIMYILSNAAYWTVAALPSRWHWDMSSFETDWESYQWHQFTRNKGKDCADVPFEVRLMDGNEIGTNPTFTEALWKAIALTQNSRWARIGEIAPDTDGWDDWLKEAWAHSKKIPQANAGVQPPDAEKKESSPDAKTIADLEEKAIHDPESLLKQQSCEIVTGASEIITLPNWNYNGALTKCLSQAKRKSW